ncbi:MAG: hypothetical protein AAFW84_20660, partial [Cyanobacteria bacterium J06635_15]
MLSSQPAQSQLAPLTATGDAPIVVDGRIVFEIHGTNNLSATERARRINIQLKQEVRNPELAIVEVVQTPDNLVYLQSQHSEAILVTITQADVITPGHQPDRQARLWADKLE